MMLFIVLALEGVILVSIWAILYQFLKQQGRLILRLDALEQRLQPLVIEPESRPLNPGDVFDEFDLPDLSGRPVALESFRGHRVLLVNWAPACGFCEALADDLARIQVDLVKQGVQLVLLMTMPKPTAAWLPNTI